MCDFVFICKKLLFFIYNVDEILMEHHYHVIYNEIYNIVKNNRNQQI